MTKDFIEGFAIGIVSGGIAVWLMVLVWFAVVSIHAPHGTTQSPRRSGVWALQAPVQAPCRMMALTMGENRAKINKRVGGLRVERPSPSTLNS